LYVTSITQPMSLCQRLFRNESFWTGQSSVYLQMEGQCSELRNLDDFALVSRKFFCKMARRIWLNFSRKTGLYWSLLY